LSDETGDEFGIHPVCFGTVTHGAGIVNRPGFSGDKMI